MAVNDGRSAIALLLTTCIAWPAWSKPPTPEIQCSIVECAAGSKVISYATKSDMYFACPTAELSDYTMMVIGMLSLSLMSGHAPNVSPVTGEPEFEGETAALLTRYRLAAGVRTFDQAIGKCQSGKNGLRLVVANNPARGQSSWVFMDGKPGTLFWMPKAHLNIKR